MKDEENVYMLIVTCAGENFWHKTGRGAGTPFTTTNLGTARAERTRYKKYYGNTRIVRIAEVNINNGMRIVE